MGSFPFNGVHPAGQCHATGMSNKTASGVSSSRAAWRAQRGWRMTSKSRRLYFRGLCLFACVLCAFTGYNAFQQSTELESPITNHVEGSRHLLNAVEIIPGFQGNVCDAGWETALGGALASIIYILLSVYLFLGVAIICDGGFVFSLELICSPFGLNLSEDVAGATFMAAGSSAPELATSFVGVFIAKNDVGLGTILGSAVFNILIIIGATALLTEGALDLDWKPVVRDNFFYSISVVLLVVLVIDESVQWYDAMILLIWNFTYLTFMYFNESFWKRFFPEDEADASEAMEMGGSKSDHGKGAGDGSIKGVITDSEHESPTMGDSLHDVPIKDDIERDAALAQAEADGTEGDEHHQQWQQHRKKRKASFSHTDWRGGEEEEEEDAWYDKVCNCFSLPWEIAYKYSMPDCHMDATLDDEDEGDKEKIVCLQAQI